MNGYRYADLALGESLSSPTVCECCGREGLKRTIKLVAPSGSPVWFGVGCAAKAMSIGAPDVERARVAQVFADKRATMQRDAKESERRTEERIASGWRPAWITKIEAGGARYEWQKGQGWTRVD